MADAFVSYLTRYLLGKCFPKGTKAMQFNASGKYSIWKNNYLGRQQIGQWGGHRFLLKPHVKIELCNLGEGGCTHMRNWNKFPYEVMA